MEAVLRLLLLVYVLGNAAAVSLSVYTRHTKNGHSTGYILPGDDVTVVFTITGVELAPERRQDVIIRRTNSLDPYNKPLTQTVIYSGGVLTEAYRNTGRYTVAVETTADEIKIEVMIRVEYVDRGSFSIALTPTPLPTVFETVDVLGEKPAARIVTGILGRANNAEDFAYTISYLNENYLTLKKEDYQHTDMSNSNPFFGCAITWQDEERRPNLTGVLLQNQNITDLFSRSYSAYNTTILPIGLADTWSVRIQVSIGASDNNFVPVVTTHGKILECRYDSVYYGEVSALTTIRLIDKPYVMCDMQTEGKVGDEEIGIRCSIQANPQLTAWRWTTPNGTIISNTQNQIGRYRARLMPAAGLDMYDSVFYVRFATSEASGAYTFFAVNSEGDTTVTGIELLVEDVGSQLGVNMLMILSLSMLTCML